MDVFRHLALLWQQVTYPALFLGMFADANVTIVAAAFLISRRELNASLIVGVITSSAFLEQLAWYSVGWWLGGKPRLAAWAYKLAGHYDRHILHRTTRSLILSKFIYGIHRATLVRCGMLKIPFWNFIKSSVTAVAVWLVIVGTLGFIFSASYTLLKLYLKYTGLALLAILLIVVVLEIIASRKLKQDL